MLTLAIGACLYLSGVLGLRGPLVRLDYTGAWILATIDAVLILFFIGAASIKSQPPAPTGRAETTQRR